MFIILYKVKCFDFGTETLVSTEALLKVFKGHAQILTDYDYCMYLSNISLN